VRCVKDGRLSDVVLVAGYAQLPQSTGAGVMWRHLTVIARIDLDSGLVVDASTTLATAVADRFVRELLIGSDPLRDSGRISPPSSGTTTATAARRSSGRSATSSSSTRSAGPS
jgi:hypothetical protein